MRLKEYLQELQMKNPSIKLDHEINAQKKIIKILEHQKNFVVKDGSLHYNSLQIKGAPSIQNYSKFTPNFRDLSCGQKPNSRGLMHGKIMQIATQALVDRGKSRRNRHSYQTYSTPKPKKRNFIMEGTKKTP